MITYIKCFTRESATFCLFDETVSKIVEEKTVDGDFTNFAHGKKNTNDFRLWDNSVSAEDLDSWHYPVPSHEHRMNKVEIDIINAVLPFGTPDMSKVILWK
jgi:hypothetical protein